MTPDERTAILDALAGLSKQDADLADPFTTFLPLPAHRYALRPDAVVVLGGRGAGKTALFRLVNDARTAARLRDFFEDERIPEATWFDAFSQGSMLHPEVGPLEALATSASDLSLRAFWMTHLLRRLHDEVPELVKLPPSLESALAAPVADLAAWLPTAEANLGAVSAALDATERALLAADKSVVATYDNLDRLGQFEPGTRRRYLSTLLALWLSLAGRYKKLRGKIFLRDDLFDAGELGFADASKLRSRAETIVWDPAALYRVVVRHVANTSDATRSWLRDVPGLELRDRGAFGWMPGEMPNDVQRDFVGALAWRVIGKGVLKGATHTWIVNRLEDANRRVTPRAVLWFFEFAGKAAQQRPAGRRKTPLISDDLVVALRETSGLRVAEIYEEYPVALRLENLRGMTLPLDRVEAVKRLGKRTVSEPEGIPSRGELILNEMVRLGLLKEGAAGHLDVPDIYRYSLEIAPDYATAWADFLKDDSPSAREQFVRELPRLREILRDSTKYSLWNLAEEEVGREDYVAARAQCERALQLVQNANDIVGEVELWKRLASISLKRHDGERARVEFLRAADLARRAGSKEDEADALWWLSIVDFDDKKFELAIDEAKRSLSLSLQAQDGDLAAWCYLMLGDIDSAQGRIAESVEQYKMALSAAQQASDGSFQEMAAFEQLAYLILANAESSPTALALLMLAAIVAKRRGESASGRIPSARDTLAARLEYTATQIKALKRSMAAAYASDRGRAFVRAAFPDRVTD